MSDSEPDSFSNARANIRDAIKWLIAAFAGLAAAIVGASPLTNLGSLPEWRLALAAVGAAAGLGCVLYVINLALQILVTPAFFLRDIVRDPDLSKFINDNRDDVLPPGFSSVGQFVENRTKISNRLFELLSKPPDAGADKAAHEAWDAAVKLQKANLTATIAVTNRLIGLAHFEKLRRDFNASRQSLFRVAVAAAAMLMLFAWAATPARQGGDSSTVRVLFGDGPEPVHPASPSP